MFQVKFETDLSNKEVAFAKLALQLAVLKRNANGDDKEALKEVVIAQAAVIDAEKLRYDNTVKFRKKLKDAQADEKKDTIAAQKEITDRITEAGNKIREDGVKTPEAITKAWYNAVPQIGGAIQKVKTLFLLQGIKGKI